MGLVQSIICSCSICIERILTWTVAALFLLLIMTTLVLLMMYGISVGYHYAQRELATIAETSRSSTTSTVPPGLRRAGDDEAVVRLLAVNRTRETGPLVGGDYLTEKLKEHILIEPTITPVFILESERPPAELSPEEKEIAKRIIGRFRRSKNMQPLSLQNDTNLFKIFPT